MDSKNFNSNPKNSPDIQVDECSIPRLNIENLIEKVTNVFQQKNIRKRFQKIFFSSLELLPDHLKVNLLKNQVFVILQKNKIYQRIEHKMKERQISKNQLIILSVDKQSTKQISQKQIFQHLRKYLIITLEYVENILQLCHQLSQGQEIIQKKLLSKSGRFFTNLHQNLRINQLLKNLIQPIQIFDPFLLKLKFKDQKNQQIDNIFNWEAQTKDRMTKINQQILKATNNQLQKKQFVMKISGLKEVLKKYSLDDTQIIREQQKNNLSPKKLSLNIQNPFKKDQQIKNQNINKRIFLNFRKKKIREKFAKSLDIKNSQIKTQERIVFSTQKIFAKECQKNILRIKQDKISKRKKLRAIILQPLEKRTQRSRLSLRCENICMTQKDTIKKNKQNIRIKSLKNRKFSQFTNRTECNHQSNNNVLHQQDCYQIQDCQSKEQIYTRRKFLCPINIRKYHNFRSQLNQNQSFYGQSLQNGSSFSNLAQKIKMKNQLNFSQRTQISKKINDSQGKSQLINLQVCRNRTQNMIQQVSQYKDQIINQEKQKVNQIDGINVLRQDSKITDKIYQQLQCNQIMVEGAIDSYLRRPSQIPQSSSQNQEKIHKHEDNQIVRQAKQNRKQQNMQNQKEKFLKDKKKILLKAPKLKQQQLFVYLNKLNIPEDKNFFSQLFSHQHYINQFYLNQQLFCIIIFSQSFDLKQLQIKLIHQINQKNLSFILDSDKKEKLRKLMIKNYIQILAKSTQNTQQIKFKSQQNLNYWLNQCEFTYDGSHFIHKLSKPQKTTQSSLKQFLSMNLSILIIQQNENQSFLFSDEICPYKSGKYDVNNKIFSNSLIQFLYQEFNSQLQTINQVNQILQTKELDTFDSNQNFQSLIQNQIQSGDNKIKLRILTFHQMLNKQFIVQNGWIKSSSYLVFHQKDQLICQFLLKDNYQLFLGKGFEHIGTMKNKILHYKTRISSSKKQKQNKQIQTKIRMFSKQLYGLIKHQNGFAFYGNWEMSFHFKHDFMGKVIYSIDTYGQGNQAVFGNQNFFVCIYCSDQFVIGWQVQDNDYLY